MIGLMTSTGSLTTGVGKPSGCASYDIRGYKYLSNSYTAIALSATQGDVIGCAWDSDAGKIWWAKNNTWMQSGDPASAANPMYTNAVLIATLFPAISFYGGHVVANTSAMTGRFIASDFAYSPPSGFSAWETSGDGSVTLTGVSGSAGAGILSITAEALLQLLGVAAPGAGGALTLSAGAQTTIVGTGANGQIGVVSISAGALATITLSGVASIGRVGTVALSAGALALLSGAHVQGRAGSLRMVEIITPGGRLIVIEDGPRVLILMPDERRLLIQPDDRLLLIQPDDSDLTIS